MKKWLLFFISIIFIHSNINADIMTEISKRDRTNPIYLTERSAHHVLYAKDGYLYTDYWADDLGEPSIVAYQIRQDIIKLIVRVKTQDFAFRIYDYFHERDGIDRFTVDVHDYYLVELVYVNDKLETYCNRIRDINANGFIYNEAKIGSNIHKILQNTYHLYYPRYDITLTEGMETKIVSLVNERTNSLVENSYTVDAYDYYYHVLIEDKQIRINGYLLDFSNKVDYRSQMLILGSGNTPQSTPPEEALDYLGTWRYTGSGGLGIDKYRRVITITLSAEELHYHFAGYEKEYEYKLARLKWTKIIRPDEDFSSYVEIPVDDFKGAPGYLITGKVINNTGEWPDTNSTTEYIYIGQNNKDIMLWYNARVYNHILVRQR